MYVSYFPELDVVSCGEDVQQPLKGTPLDDFDIAIAACALAHNLTLITNNEKHFRRVEGLKLDNWARP